MTVTHNSDFHRLGYAKLGAREWSHYSQDYDGVKWSKPARVGPVYATKTTLLADNQRYAQTWGY